MGEHNDEGKPFIMEEKSTRRFETRPSAGAIPKPTRKVQVGVRAGGQIGSRISWGMAKVGKQNHRSRVRRVRGTTQSERVLKKRIRKRKRRDYGQYLLASVGERPGHEVFRGCRTDQS